ncbi:hypothetical protein HOLleu_35365 [Holothuria leucospilota]|uniref:G-protein coupled receptors family 1 profile domain-containing protein n=1 Tax=Holothuria leucospilota TaxID=206669 RepID=A0A9Q1BG20_HOLLE|nr:hypothetical protein HOLleu_35365 [Holothuria leucospilota]
MEIIYFFPYASNDSYKIVTYVLICVAFVCNIPVFTSICLRSFLERSRNKYIISMSVANLMVLMDLSLISILSSSSVIVEGVTVSVVIMYEFIAEVHLVLILLDQYRVASQPTVTNAETDNTRMKRRLFTVWLSSVIMMSTVTLLMVFLYANGRAFLVAALFLLPYILALVVSSLLTANVIRTMKQSDRDLGDENLSRLRKIRQVSLAILAVVVAFFVMLFPSKVYVWFLYLSRDNASLEPFSFIVVVGYILAAGATPFILIILSSEYREIFCRCCIRGRDSSVFLPVSSKVEEPQPLNGVDVDI